MNPQYGSSQPYYGGPYYPPQQPYQQPYQQPQQQQQYKQNYNGAQTPVYGSQEPIYGQGADPHAGRFDDSAAQRGSRYKDIWATALFLANLIAFGVFSGLSFSATIKQLSNPSTSNSTSSTTSSSTSAPLSGNAAAMFATIAVVGALASALLTAGWVVLMKTAPKALIKVTFILSILFWFVIAGVNFWAGVIFGGILALLMGALYAFMFYSWRHRIPFSALILETIADVGNKYPASYFLTFVSLIVGIAFQVYWLLSVFGAPIYFKNTSDSGLYALLVFFIFSLYWITQVIRNVMYCTICGAVSTYYFLHSTTGASSMPKNPTLAALGRSLSTSFGSICFGSLLVALIQLIRSLVQQAAREQSFIACFADCILACLQGLLEYFNDYAYIYVSMKGDSFIDAAKNVMNLVRTSGVQAIVNDMLIGPVVGITGFLIGCFSGGLSFVWVYFQFEKERDQYLGYMIALAFFNFYIGLMCVYIVGMFVQAGARTLFVCMAEKPDAMRTTKPELYEKVRQLYPQITWG